MKTEAARLNDLLTKWREWSLTADQSGDGWEACFTEWELLMTSTGILMTQGEITDEELKMVEVSWQISEEDEDMVDYAKANLALCWTTLIRLVLSKIPKVRWQVYEVLSEGGNQAEMLLRHGLNDEDSYCRRRAILSLGKVKPIDAKNIAAQFVNDPDPYIRQAASELARVSSA